MRVIAAFSQIFGCKDQNRGGGGNTHTSCAHVRGFFPRSGLPAHIQLGKKARNGFKNPIKLCLKGKEQEEERILMEF